MITAPFLDVRPHVDLSPLQEALAREKSSGTPWWRCRIAAPGSSQSMHYRAAIDDDCLTCHKVTFRDKSKNRQCDEIFRHLLTRDTP